MSSVVQSTRLRQIAVELEPEEVPPEPTPPSISAAPRPGLLEGVDVGLLGLVLLKISQRFVIALGHLFTAAAVGSAFWLFFSIRLDPSVPQLILAGLYAVFVLAAVALKERPRR